MLGCFPRLLQDHRLIGEPQCMAVVRMQASSGEVLVNGLEARRSLVYSHLPSAEQAIKNPAIADGVMQSCCYSDEVTDRACAVDEVVHYINGG